MRAQEDEKKYRKALRFIYKFGQETNKLTEEATEACRRQKINAEELIYKSVEDFAANPKPNAAASSPTSPRNRHQVELQESENNLALVRHKHHETRRRSKCVCSFFQSKISLPLASLFNSSCHPPLRLPMRYEHDSHYQPGAYHAKYQL